MPRVAQRARGRKRFESRPACSKGLFSGVPTHTKALGPLCPASTCTASGVGEGQGILINIPITLVGKLRSLTLHLRGKAKFFPISNTRGHSPQRPSLSTELCLRLAAIPRCPAPCVLKAQLQGQMPRAPLQGNSSGGSTGIPSPPCSSRQACGSRKEEGCSTPKGLSPHPHQPDFQASSFTQPKTFTPTSSPTARREAEARGQRSTLPTSRGRSRLLLHLLITDSTSLWPQEPFCHQVVTSSLLLRSGCHPQRLPK